MKLTQSTKDAILTMKAQGYSSRSIGRVLNIGKSTVNDFLAAQRKVDEKVLETLDTLTEMVKDQRKRLEEVGLIRTGPRILFLDVEVSPSVVVAFSRFKAFSSPDHVLKEPYMLTYVVKWKGEPQTYGNTILDANKDYPEGSYTDDYQLISALWEYLDKADIVVAQNAKFDRGWFNQRCVVHGLNPPSPYKLVDTLAMLKKNFALPSNSLAAAAQYFGLTRKKDHSGINLWIRCMNGEREAFGEMLDYNDGDVVTLEELYNTIQPFVQELPNMALYHKDSAPRCAGCGSSEIVETEKSAYTALSEFKLVQCKGCGKYSRMRTNLRSKEQMQATLTNVM